MDFAEYWKETWLDLDFPETAHDVERIVRSAYRAGLLHAAKQDREESGKYDGKYATGSQIESSLTLLKSAKSHEQAANDLK